MIMQNLCKREVIMERFTALEIAKYVIGFCAANKNPISNLQLQKILYFVQGEYYKATGHFLFKDDFVAWTFGPVVKAVYDNYSGYGSSRIYDRSDVYLDQSIRNIIDPVITKRANQSASTLIEETHQRGGAWHTVYDSCRNTVIPRLLIMKEFSQY